MNHQLKVSFENIGVSSYLAVGFPPEMPVIGYQMEMITSNEISHLLHSSKRMINGSAVIYYNISSKIRLSQILERRKLKKDELICLIHGALQAIQEGREYQLPEEGLVMEPDYIYVEPDTCSPSFVYLPVQGADNGDLRKLLQNLIMKGMIEMSQDNFIQVLLEVLSRDPFSIDQLSFSMEQLEKRPRARKPEPIPAPGPSFSSQPVPPAAVPVPPQPQPPFQPQPQPQPTRPTQEPMPAPNPPRPQVPGTGQEAGRKAPSKKKKGKKAPETEKVMSQEENFDREKAKKKFLLPQAVIMVALAAMVSFGFFTDGSGGIALKNIFAVVLIVAVAEVILYREAYVNGKNASGKSKPKKQEVKAKSRAKTVQTPGSRPPVPPQRGKGPVPEQPSAPVPPVVKAPVYSAPPVAPAPQPPVQPMPSAAPVPPLSPAAANPMPNYGFQPSMPAAAPEEEDKTELWEGMGAEDAYLEYYVNGMMDRVFLNKPSTLVGRLSSQVDYQVTNPKVGKVHAEFLNQNGVIYVVDQNSKNGTYINHSTQRITSNVPYPLKDNDRISLADSEFILHCPVR